MKYLFTALILCMSLIGFTQSYSLDDVGRYSVRNSGSIVDGNVIKGYYIFYEVEKVDRKNRAFEIVILDENLGEVAKEKIVEPKTSYLMEATYNGSAILFKFYDSKAKSVAYRAMSNDGKLSSKETRDANKAEIATYNSSITQDMENVNLYNFGDDLFVDVIIYKGKKYIYKVQAVDNKGNLAWEYSPEEQKGVLTGGFLASSDELLVLVEAQSPRATSRDYTFNLKTLNHQGEVEFEIDLGNNRYNLLPQNAFIDDEKDVIVVMGEYFNSDDKSMKSESIGLFVKTVDMNGKEINESFLSWSRDIYSSLSADERKEASKHYTYFHNMVKAKDGRIIAVGEQYKKQVSAGGVALNVLASATGGSTDASALEIKIGNMVLVELDENYELSAVEYHEKTPNRVILPQGYGIVNKHILAKLMDAIDAFDYAFLMNNEDYSEITVAYYDREKVDGKLGKDLVLNFVNYNANDHTYTHDQINLEADGTSAYVYPAKPGNVMMIVYDRKEKTIKFRLEPINN